MYLYSLYIVHAHVKLYSEVKIIVYITFVVTDFLRFYIYKHIIVVTIEYWPFLVRKERMTIFIRLTTLTDNCFAI
jgi:hypothetical protein